MTRDQLMALALAARKTAEDVNLDGIPLDGEVLDAIRTAATRWEQLADEAEAVD